jgi:hypothetical protein
MQPRSPWTRHDEVTGEQTNSSTHAYTRNAEEVRGERSAHNSAALFPGKRALCAHWVETKMGPKFGLHGLKREKFRLSGIEPHFLGRSARSPITVQTTLFQLQTRVKYK